MNINLFLKTTRHRDAKIFADIIKKTKLTDTTIKFGNFYLKGYKGNKSKIQFNQEDFEILDHKHEYTFPLLKGNLEVSLQLYENLNEHYRLFCYVKFGKKSGMTFSLNLTTEKESKEIIYLTQKIKFSERYKGNKELAKAHRRRKQIVFMDLLKQMEFDITDNEDVILGIFNPKEKKFVNTSNEKFLNDFLIISILKGHFQGNKGYQLDILPNYNQLDYIFNRKSNGVEKNEYDKKISASKKRRNIPLGMRYKILKRDNFKCVACGRTVDDGIKLHIDHKIPFSLGGLTEMSNLQTLCNECNISKSNKFIDK